MGPRTEPAPPTPACAAASRAPRRLPSAMLGATLKALAAGEATVFADASTPGRRLRRARSTTDIA